MKKYMLASALALTVFAAQPAGTTATLDIGQPVDAPFVGRAPIVYSETAELSSATPEPATWAFILVGVSAVGYTLRQKKKHRPQAV